MDRFDEIWKNRFNENDLPVEGWNDPDAQVWEGIDASLEKDNRRLGGIWFWVGAGAILLILMSILWLSNSFFQPNQISENIDIQTNTQLALSNTKEDNAQPLSLDQTPVAFNSTKKSPDLKTPALISKTTIAKPSQNPILEAFSSATNVENQLSERSTQYNDSHRPFLGDKAQKGSFLASEIKEVVAITSFHESEKKVKLDLLTQLPILQNPLSSSEAPQLQLTDIQPVTKPIGSSKRFVIEATAGAIYWFHRTSDNYTDDLSAYEFYGSNEIGWQAGINLGWDINNYLELSAGAQFEKVEVLSGHNGDLTYSPTAETNGQQNTYNLSLATPYGFSAAQFVLNRSTDVGNDDVNLKVDFHSAHAIENVRMPVDLKIHPFGKSRTFAPFVQVGGGFNYLTKVSNQISEIETHHSAIQFNDSGLAFAKPDINKSFFDVSLGGGVSYQINATTGFNLTYQFARGLRPVFEMQDYETAIDRQRLTVGWKKKF